MRRTFNNHILTDFLVKRIVPCLLLFLLAINLIYAQTDSTLNVVKEKKIFLREQIVPFSLITSGALLNIGDIKNRFAESIPSTDVSIDDYLQYTPMAEMYLFDVAGFKSSNNVFNQTKCLAFSQLSASIIVEVLKRTFNVERPNGGDNSFPSGHTACAFVGATVLYHEFRDTKPVLAYSGFAIATATGFLRTTNNAHWLPDVVTSAGIGILTVNLVYYLEPLKCIQLPVKNRNVSLSPSIGYNSFYFAINF